MLLKMMRGISVLLVVFAALSCLPAQTVDTATMQQKLNGVFVATRFRSDWSDIIQPGSVVILKKDGLLMYQATVPQPPVSNYKNGKISQGFGDSLAVSLADGMNRPGGAASIPKKTLVAGEKCWVSSVAVTKGEIDIRLVTDVFDDGRYFGFIKFQFPKKGAASPDDMMAMIAEALDVDNSQAPGHQPAVPAAQPAPPQESPAPAQQSIAPLAPPPPPADAPPPAPKTISLGQTKDQVAAQLGPPQKVVQLGAKEIDYYPDMKITFVGGKVSDVQ